MVTRVAIEPSYTDDKQGGSDFTHPRIRGRGYLNESWYAPSNWDVERAALARWSLSLIIDLYGDTFMSISSMSITDVSSMTIIYQHEEEEYVWEEQYVCWILLWEILKCEICTIAGWLWYIWFHKFPQAESINICRSSPCAMTYPWLELMADQLRIESCVKPLPWCGCMAWTCISWLFETPNLFL